MHSLLLNALSRPALDMPASGVHAVCGPSGAGKTLMVGRLALAAAQKLGAESQAMVSFADQRPGAWAQMQLLAAQSGVACYRAVDSDTLRMLLEDLGGKTVWIDTCGTDFLGQAQRLLDQHPKVLRHAVLPVDATVTSVHKILQNPSLSWSSLMLSKVDEAAYPWALIKGLTEQPLPVSCMADNNLIGTSLLAFDADRLVNLALAPMTTGVSWAVQVQSQPETPKPLGCMSIQDSQDSQDSQGKFEPVVVKKPARRPRVHKAMSAVGTSSCAPILAPDNINSFLQEDILIPTLLGSVPVTTARKKAANGSGVLKVAHG